MSLFSATAVKLSEKVTIQTIGEMFCLLSSFPSQVPDYLELVKTPMDLGTIRDKLKNLEYPDVESFVADVRLVFSNSDKYNLVCHHKLLCTRL